MLVVSSTACLAECGLSYPQDLIPAFARADRPVREQHVGKSRISGRRRHPGKRAILASSRDARALCFRFKFADESRLGPALQAGAQRWSASQLPAAAAAVPLPRRRLATRLQPRAAATRNGNGSQNAVLEREAALGAPLAGPVADQRSLARSSAAATAEQQPGSASHAAGAHHQAEGQWRQDDAQLQVQDVQQVQQQQQQLHERLAATQGAVAAAQALPPAGEAGQQSEAQPSALWALVMMTLGYLHLSVTLYALPSLVPFIAQDLRLDDTQGALLTTGYTVRAGLRGDDGVGRAMTGDSGLAWSSVLPGAQRVDGSLAVRHLAAFRPCCSSAGLF